MAPPEDELSPDEIEGLMQNDGGLGLGDIEGLMDDDDEDEELDTSEEEMLAAMGGVRPVFEDDDEDDGISATPVQLQQLDGPGTLSGNTNLDLVLDVQLPVVVELGRTKKLVKEVLQLQRGSVITLDKMAGEPANLVINGTIMATGEVVVIDDNFGLRITNMVSREDRLRMVR